MNPIAADRRELETQMPNIRCTTADQVAAETQGTCVGRHPIAADHVMRETQGSVIRCRRQAKYHVKSMADLPAATLLPMGQFADEIRTRVAHRTTADQPTIETQHRNVGRHLLPMGHSSVEIQFNAAHRNRRRTMAALKPRDPISAADLSPHWTTCRVKSIYRLSGAAIYLADAP